MLEGKTISVLEVCVELGKPKSIWLLIIIYKTNKNFEEKLVKTPKPLKYLCVVLHEKQKACEKDIGSGDIDCSFYI